MIKRATVHPECSLREETSMRYGPKSTYIFLPLVSPLKSLLFAHAYLQSIHYIANIAKETILAAIHNMLILHFNLVIDPLIK